MTTELSNARGGLTLDDMRASDRDFALAAFRAWDLDCHSFRGESAWRAMAEATCSDADHLERIVVRDGEDPVAFLIVITRPGEFWRLYLSGLGLGALARKLSDSVVRFLTRAIAVAPGDPGEGAGPVDQEFAGLARRSHTTRPHVAWGLLGYVDPRYRKPPTAFLMYRKMFDRLRGNGFVRLEGQIRFGNEESVVFHRALGFEVRNAGPCLHAVKTLASGGSGSQSEARADR